MKINRAAKEQIDNLKSPYYWLYSLAASIVALGFIFYGALEDGWEVRRYHGLGVLSARLLGICPVIIALVLALLYLWRSKGGGGEGSESIQMLAEFSDRHPIISGLALFFGVFLMLQFHQSSVVGEELSGRFLAHSSCSVGIWIDPRGREPTPSCFKHDVYPRDQTPERAKTTRNEAYETYDSLKPYTFWQLAQADGFRPSYDLRTPDNASPSVGAVFSLSLVDAIIAAMFMMIYGLVFCILVSSIAGIVCLARGEY